MEKVTSGDGTRIAFERSGEGPRSCWWADPWRITASTSRWQRNCRKVSRCTTSTVAAEEGGDARPYAVEREVEDVGALVGHAEGPVFLYGHSAGSALALRAAASGLDVAKLALADPPFTPRGQNDEAARAEHAEQAAHIQELNDRGDYKGSVKYFLKDYGLPDEDLEAMFRSPAGEAMLDCARAFPHDYAVLGDGLLPTELAAAVDVPTLILAAEATPETARALADAMPNATFRAMGASAHELSPEALAPVLKEFFGQP